jgi:hypothetical protein
MSSGMVTAVAGGVAGLAVVVVTVAAITPGRAMSLFHPDLGAARQIR